MFPKWLYHKECGGKIVNSPEEEAKLGKGWCDTPAAFAEPSVCDEPVEKAKPVKVKKEKGQ